MPKKEKTEKVTTIDVDVPDEGDTYPAKVTALDVVKAVDIFGDKAKEPDRPTIRGEFEGPGGVSGNFNLSAPGITADGKVIARNPKSNLYKYVKKYHKGPFVGQAVVAAINEDGFYRLVIE
jgi:hypothetical protein